MKNNYGTYSFSVWFFTLVLGTLTGGLISFFIYEERFLIEDIFVMWLLDFIYGVFFSLPFYLLFILLNGFLFKTNITPLRLKIYLTFIIPLFIGTGWSISFGFQNDRDSLLYMICTLVIVVFGIWIFKIEKEIKPLLDPRDEEILDDFDFEK